MDGVEVCVDSLRSARCAIAAGAMRLELCMALSEGGLTPSYGLMVHVCKLSSVPVRILIRPRAADFVYDEDEAQLMLLDISMAKKAGAAGVVIGALTAEGEVDMGTLTRLMDEAAPLPCTFHRAIDMSRDPLHATRCLHALSQERGGQLDRILTSGGHQDAHAGSAVIREMVKISGSSLIIVAGGGVQESNVLDLVEKTGVREVHGTLRSACEGRSKFRKSGVHMGKVTAEDSALVQVEYTHKYADEKKITGVIQLLQKFSSASSL